MKKRILLISALAMSLVLSLNMSAQDKWKFTEASELTLVGKLFRTLRCHITASTRSSIMTDSQAANVIR